MTQQPQNNSLQFLMAQFARHYSFCTYNQCEKIGVHPGQIPLLKALSLKDGQSQSELAASLSVRPSTVTMMIRRMGKNGLIVRKTDHTDLRIIRVFLHEKGRTALTEAEQLFCQLDEQLLADFSPTELDEMYRLFTKLQNNILLTSKD